MNNIIAHIIGIDEIHKQKLKLELPTDIKIIDLDKIQQIVYNHADVVENKLKWELVSKNIVVKKKQKIMMDRQNIRADNLDDQIKKLMIKRNGIKKDIHNKWKDLIMQYMEIEVDKCAKNKIIVIGYNVFPKDYRVRINIQLPIIPELSNRIIFDIDPKLYAANQIKFYLTTYSDKIIRGVFPLRLLTTEYLITKYEKIYNFYEKINYKAQVFDNIISLLNNIVRAEIPTDKIYVVTMYKSADIIPVNSRTPIEGFLTKEEAISNMKTKIRKDTPVYIYEVDSHQFHKINGKLLAAQELYPINEESCLITQN